MKTLELASEHKRILIDAVARGYAVPVRCDSVADLMRRAKAEAMTETALLRVTRTTAAEIVYAATDFGRSLA